MKRITLVCLLLAGCSSEPAMMMGPVDAGPGMDAGPVTCADDTDCPGSYCNPGSFECCRPASPPYELCGDRIDQDCDRRDQGCGDNDRDGVAACTPGQDPIRSGCDCNDMRADVRPAVGALPGAPEACDGIDNDCNGRADESAACCEACASLGANRDRADVCTTDGVCDCSTDAASGPCAEGLTCCVMGCVNVQTDFMNCGFCGAHCTVSSDRCVAGSCTCGETGAPCELDIACVAGSCG